MILERGAATCDKITFRARRLLVLLVGPLLTLLLDSARRRRPLGVLVPLVHQTDVNVQTLVG